MADRPPPPPPLPPRRPAPRAGSAGGALIALGAVGGAAIGFVIREPTIAFLIGTALGIAAAAAMWVAGRRG